MLNKIQICIFGFLLFLSKMGTNPLGKGTKNVSVNMAGSLRDDLAKLADASGLSLSAYIKTVLAGAVEDGAIITTRIEKDQGKSPRIEEK